MNKSRLRFNSFELSDTEASYTSSLKNTIIELQQYFPEKPLEINDVDSLIDESIENGDIAEVNDTVKQVPVYNIKFIKNVRKDMQCTENLKTIRYLLDNSVSSDEVLNWDLLIKDGFDVERYITFIYTLMKLFDVNQSDKINKELSFNAGRTYVCLLGLPGAKRCMVWEPSLVTTYFKMLNIHQKLKQRDHYLEIQIIQMLKECKNVFNIVCLNDQEEVLEKYIDTLSSLLEYYLTSTNHSASEAIKCCYENLESLCLRPLPDKDIENVMYIIFCRTVDLHFITVKRRQSIEGKHGEAIYDFFLYLLFSYSSKAKNVLLKFIKSILSNVDLKFEREKFQKLMDVAVKYELAIYLKYEGSIVEYLQQLSMASDHRQRLNGVEFCGKMLLLNSTPEPSSSLTFDTPREAEIIKILFQRIYDKQDNIKLKALNSIKLALLNGNEYAKKIFQTVFKASSDDNPEIINILGEETKNFQNNLLSLLQHSNATYIKKTCLEIMGKIFKYHFKIYTSFDYKILYFLGQYCDNLLDNEIFISIIKSMADDPSYLVKMQLLEMINNIVKEHSKNNNAVEMWLDVILNLIRDNDNKIVDASVKSLTSIFQRIDSFENTVTDLQILPWTVVRLILSKGKRGVLKNAIDLSSTNILSQDKLRKIESHIFTSNKTEAWCILSLIAKKMKSNNPEIVLKAFLDTLNDENFDSNDFFLILEIIRNWIDTFSVAAKTQIASKLTTVLESGKCPISFVSHLYEIAIYARATISNKEDAKKFIGKLNFLSKKFILDHCESFEVTEQDEKFLSFLLIYCESNTDLSSKPDRNVLKFLFKFLKKILNDKLSVTVQKDIPRKLNIVIIVLTRFAIRDHELASELTPDLAALLRKPLNISIINTTMKCLNDLCKKHTSTVAPVFKEIVFKLHSKSEEIRLCALKNIYELVMQDFIKMKGRVLLNMLACIVDKNETIQLKSQAAILSYVNDKNPNLLYTCFIESVFLFNNFFQSDNFGVFPLDEIDANYLLLNGDDKKEQRHELYQFFVQNINDLNEVHLLLLLKQIIIFKEKFEKNKFRHHINGVRTFNDFLYIFKLICDKRGESKTKINKGEVSEDYAEEQDVPQSSKENEKTSNRKNKNVLSINDAISVVEKMILIYPAFVTEVMKYDKSLQMSAEELTKSIATNFANFIEYSKDKFWEKVQKKCERAGKKRKSTRKIADSDTDNDEDNN
jgi:condensin-2 complex subunit D3